MTIESDGAAGTAGAAERPNRLKVVAFVTLSVLAVAYNFVWAWLAYVLRADDSPMRDVQRSLADFPAVLLLLNLPHVLTALAWILSLDGRRRARPRLVLGVLVGSYAAFVAGSLLGRSNVTLDNFPVFGGALLGVLLAPFVFFVAEKFVGLGLGQIADKLVGGGAMWPGAPLAKLAVTMAPDGIPGLRARGLSLSAAGDDVRALADLHRIRAAGDKSPQVLEALATSASVAGDRAEALQLFLELHHSRPTPENLQHLLEALLDTNRRKEALEIIEGLDAETKAQHAELHADLLFTERRFDDLNRLATEFEHDGPPFTRARQVHEKVLDHNPKDAASLRALISLNRRMHHDDEVADLQERLALVDPHPAPIHRELVAHYRARGQEKAVLQHLGELVAAGTATTDEKLEILAERFRTANLAAIQNLMAHHPDLADHPRALYYLAATQFENEDEDAALTAIEAARTRNPDSAVAGQLATIEKRITQRRTQDSLKRLEAQLQDDPENTELRLELVTQLIAEGSMDRAVSELERVTEKNPELFPRIEALIATATEKHGTNSRIELYLADAHLRLGDFDRVHEIYTRLAERSLTKSALRREGAERILERAPNHLASLEVLAREEHAAGNSAAALALIDRLHAARAVGGPEWQRLELDAATAANDHPRAWGLLQNLLLDSPTDVALLERATELAEALKIYDEVLALWRRAHEQSPGDVPIEIAMRKFEERRRRARVAELDAELSRGEDSVAVRHELGNLHYDLSEFNDAIVHYQAAAQAGHNVSRAKLAYVMACKSLFRESEEVFQDVELRFGQPPTEQAQIKAIMIQTCDLFEAEKQYERALNLCRRILKIDAGYSNVLERIEHLERMASKKARSQF